jgi:hypothetical protein
MQVVTLYLRKEEEEPVKIVKHVRLISADVILEGINDSVDF